MTQTPLSEKISRSFGKLGLQIKKHSPEILMVAGVVGVVASAVLACKATIKANEIIKEDQKGIDIVKGLIDAPEKMPADYAIEDAKKDLNIMRAKTGLKLVKEYAGPVALGALSIGCIFASNKILRTRNVALAAAYASIDSSFKGYRERLIDRFGEELDKELKYNVQTKEVEETIVDEKGKEKTVKKTVNVVSEQNSPYSFFFDNGCIGWQKDAEHNKWFILQQERYANEKLRTQGFLFLNDVYDMFGIPRTKTGQIVGWFYDEKKGKDNYVDFGVFSDIHNEKKRDFVNGYERVVIIDPNVDGPILDLI